jgi:hypothetical protein
MSQLNVDNIRNRTGSNGGPNFPSGITVAVGQTAYIHGNLQVDGTETIVNTETLNVADKTVGIGSTSNASNTTADGAGIEVFASSSQTGNNKTITWQNSSSAWTFGGGGIVATDAVVGSAVTINSSGIKAGIITATNGLTVSGNIGLAGANYGSSGQVLTSGGSGANASWTTISAAPEFAGIASGSITGGKAVCVADDGKLMEVTGQNQAQGTSTTFGDPSTDFSIVYDSVNEKYVYFFRDTDNNDYGQVMVGTPNGTTITWGAKQLFSPTTITPEQIHAIYDYVNQKSVVMYRDNANNGAASVQVCSLSGTTLTIGAKVEDASDENYLEYSSFCFCPTSSEGAYYAIVFNGGGSNKGWCRIGKYSGTNSSTWPSNKVEFLGAQARGTGCFYDTTADKLCVMAHDSTDSNTGYIWAGTIASDAVTFGTGQKYAWDNADGAKFTGAHDSSTGKNILSYALSGFKGVCRTATLSGTTFTFGDQYQYDDSVCNKPVIVYGSGPNKFLITYVDAGDSNYVKSIITTLTGTTITYGTQHTFQTAGNGSTADPWLLYNDDAKNFLACYRTDIGGNKAAYYIEAIRQSNVTKGNYVGIANASVTDGQTASTALPGAVNTAVSGLTVGQKYYVIADGTLSSTADSEAIDAGNAIAVNKLLVR